MDIELIKKLEELIDIFEHSSEIKKIKELKEEIKSDEKLKKLLEEYRNKSDDLYTTEKVEIKRAIINNEKVSEYKKLENQLYLLVLMINKKLNTLTGEWVYAYN